MGQLILMFSHKLKIKRRYIKAYKDQQLSIEVINMLRSPNRPSLKKISLESNINYETIRYWSRKLTSDANYMPGKTIGNHRRIFKEDEEREIADMIRTQYIQHNIIIKRKHLRKILINAWRSFDPENRIFLPQKRIFSYQFLKDFCKRNHFSFRQMRKKKRSIIDQNEVDEYTTEICNAFVNYGPRYIGNMDETPWNFVYKRGEILAITGKEEVDSVLPDDYRKSFTVIATISAAGEKYPPVFLAQGKTSLCHRQFDGMVSDPKDYEVYHSSGGNTDDSAMEFYLRCYSRWMKGKKCALVLDRYASHVSDNTQNVADSLGIKLIYIPTSATDEYQPLDKRVFGILKSMASSAFDDKVFEEQNAFTKQEAADLFVTLWKRLSYHAIMSAWEDNDTDSTNHSDVEESTSSDSSFSDSNEERSE